MERGICLIAVFYFCIKTFFLYNVIGQQRYQCLSDFGSHDVIGHVTIRLAVPGFL